jgi:hypothetical protein
MTGKKGETLPKMSAKKLDLNPIIKLFNINKIATLDELKDALNTRSTMSVFRKLKILGYLSSYSHRGKYYTLPEISKFNQLGLWSYHSVWFSKYGNLIETAKEFIDTSHAGYSVHELEYLLNVETKHVLLNLFKNKRVHREKIAGYYVYFAFESPDRKNQIALRQTGAKDFEVDLAYEIKLLSEELKAAIILFFSLLDEKQRRLYAGLEAYKLGHGGDTQIAQLLGLDVHTVARGRKQLFSQDVTADRIRQKGAGRKTVEKKFHKSPKKSSGS